MDGNKKKDDALFLRYLDGFYTKDDIHKLQEIIKDPEALESFNKISENEWDESSHVIVCDWERERYKKEARLLLKRIIKGKSHIIKRLSITVASIAAIVFLIIGLSLFKDYWEEKQIIYLEAKTSYGEIKDITLPDGTELTLNSCSKVRYPNRFITDERRIELEGEGYFKVSRNEEQPFIVNTTNFNVQVLGTKFNVKSYQTDQLVFVNVESGQVQVNMPEAMMRLKASEQVCINTLSGHFQKTEIKTKVAKWQEGELFFHQTPIHDVAKELERIYNCKIVFEEGNYNNLITGEHDNDSLIDVLRSIEYISGIHYRIEGDQIVLYK